MKHYVYAIGRNCDGCTKCCEGYLTGEAFGHHFSPGNPCKFHNKKGCSIYEQRPYNPCKVFQCQWKSNLNIPEWLKPDKSGVIIGVDFINDFRYLRLVKSPIISEKVYNWADELSKTGVHIVADYADYVLLYSTSEEFKKAYREKVKDAS